MNSVLCAIALPLRHIDLSDWSFTFHFMYSVIKQTVLQFMSFILFLKVFCIIR